MLKKVAWAILALVMMVVLAFGLTLWLTGGPVAYVRSDGVVLEASQWKLTREGDKQVFFSAEWAQANRSRCETVWVPNDYETHSDEWVE